MTYDSDFERRIAPHMESLGFVRCDDHFRLDGSPQLFRDKTGAAFSAKADFWHPELNLFVETKSGTLNTKTTVKTAASAVARAEHDCRLRGKPFTTYHMMQNQWCHSRYKQSLMQRALTPQHLIVVFERPVPYATMLAYAKAGLVAIHLDALANFLRYIRLIRLGLPVQWQLPYMAEGFSFVL